MPRDVDVSNLRMWLSNAPGGSASRTLTIYQGVSSFADGSLTVTCGPGDTDCISASNLEDNLSMGDMFMYKWTATGGPVASEVSASYKTHQGKELIYCGGANSNASASSLEYYAISGDETHNGAGQRAEVKWLTEATLVAMYVKCLAAPTGSDTFTFTFQIDSTNTTFACTMSAGETSCCSNEGGTDGCDNDTVVDLENGDLLRIKGLHTDPATIGRCHVGVAIRPDVMGEGMLFASHNQEVALSSTEYTGVFGADDLTQSTQNRTQAPAQEKMVVTELYAKSDPGPPSLNTVVVALQQNGSDTALSCTMSGITSDTECTDTDTIEVAEEDLLNTRIYNSDSLGGNPPQRLQISYKVEYKGSRRAVIAEELMDPAAPIDYILRLELENDCGDSSGNVYDFIESGAVNYVAGVIGNAGDFEEAGSDYCYNTANEAVFDFEDATEDFSISLWFSKDQNNENEALLTKLDGDNDGWRMNTRSDNTIRCSLDFRDAVSATTITDTDWHHMVCVWDRDGNLTLYLDGREDGSISLDSRTMDTTADTTVAKRTYSESQYFTGQIDDIRIFDRVLTVNEVYGLYNQRF